MRNLMNAIKRVAQFKGPLSKSIVCHTAKQTMNQYRRGWLKPEGDLFFMLQVNGVRHYLESPLLGRRLDKELTKEGREWLKRFFFTSKGIPRRTKAVAHLPDSVFETIKTFSHFTFMGFDQDDNGEYLPIWKVWSKKGGSFLYTYNGGQYNPSGGLFVTSIRGNNDKIQTNE